MLGLSGSPDSGLSCAAKGMGRCEQGSQVISKASGTSLVWILMVCMGSGSAVAAHVDLNQGSLWVLVT